MFPGTQANFKDTVVQENGSNPQNFIKKVPKRGKKKINFLFGPKSFHYL